MQKRIGGGEDPRNVTLDDYDIPPPPIRYTVMKWRQRMRVSPVEAAITPFGTVMQDLEMLDYEVQYGPKRDIMESKQE